MRTSDALRCGIQPRALYWMVEQGLLERLGRGVYQLASHPLPSHPDLVSVIRRIPNAIVCLLSALEFHEIGTQIPGSVQIALSHGHKSPRIASPRITVFHMSPESISAGTEDHVIGSTPIRVFGVAKTIADCFKFRGRIGLDVAVEAIRDGLASGKASPAEIMNHAHVDRVSRVIQPFLRALS